MTTHPNDMQPKEQSVPSVMVHGLSFQYRLLDEDTKDQPSSAQSQPAAIEDISFTLQKGELLLIAGPSGCGKSTLLKCLNGLIPHSYHGTLTGEIYLNGQNIAGLSLRDLAQIVGTMVQDPDKQIIGSTVELEIAFGLENLNTPRPEMRRQVQAVAHRLHLESILKRETFALSGGQRQQVAAAGLLVMHPSIYLFDEPFANLDSRAIDELEELIASLRAEGHTIILVEHRVEEALHLHPNKVMLMQDGRQVFFGDVQTFMQYADPTQIKLPVQATLRTRVSYWCALSSQDNSRPIAPQKPFSPLSMSHIATACLPTKYFMTFLSLFSAAKPSPCLAPTAQAKPHLLNRLSASYARQREMFFFTMKIHASSVSLNWRRVSAMSSRVPTPCFSHPLCAKS